MSIIPQVSHAMRTLLTTTTEDIAATRQFVKRPDKAKFTPSTLVQTLVYGWLAHPTATVEQLAQMAGQLGVDVSPQAVDDRFGDPLGDAHRRSAPARPPRQCPARDCCRPRRVADPPALHQRPGP